MANLQSLTDLLAKWDELREQGREVSAEQLCAESPEMLPELKIQIDRLKAMDWLDAASEPSTSDLEVSPTDDLLESLIGQATIPAVLGGRYEMKSLMAEGGFSQVWRALDRSLGRPVAVKVTTVNCYSEARRVAQLKHHGIVTVHDVGNADNLCYIVFDLVEGHTLEEQIRLETLDWRQSARIVREVAQSVQFAHNKGFIHRDIKPANILIDESGAPILTDFGIAVTECELRHEAMTSVGTLAYMAPEQLQPGKSIDVRTDVYGLGVVFYELLTGRRPFSQSTLSALRAAILAGAPPAPRSLNSAIPEPVERICLKCLSPKREDRYPHAKDLAEAIAQQLASSES